MTARRHRWFGRLSFCEGTNCRRTITDHHEQGVLDAQELVAHSSDMFAEVT